MDSSDFNKERRRTKTGLRAKWAKALLRPQTLTVLIGVGKMAALGLRLVLELIDIARK